MRNFNSELFTRAAQKALIDAVGKAQEKSYLGVFAALVDSMGSSESYPYLTSAPVMSAVKDVVENRGLDSALYTVSNQTYAVRMTIPREALSDDQVGGYLARIEQMATLATLFPNKLLVDALTTGNSALGFDGAAFFADSHTFDGTHDNLLGGSGTSVSQIQADVASAIAEVLSFRDSKGSPLNEGEDAFVIVAPPALRANMQTALYGDIVSNTSNKAFMDFSIRLVTSARLAGTDANDYYLLATGQSMPLFVQQREPVSLEILGEGTDFWTEHRAMLAQVSWRGAAAYGPYWRGAKVVNT
jgi:hypothetical protein